MSDRMVETDKELEEVLNSHKTIIRLVGTGGGGNNTVTRLAEVGINGVEIVAVNTDAQDLLYAKADHKILIGRSITNGLGAGSDPLRGEESARESLQEIEKVLEGSDMVFVTCGLGGGTGTGSAPIIAEVARKIGALTIAIVTLPFEDEGVVRWQNARRGLEELQQKVDTVIVVQNDRLMDLVPDMSLSAAFKVADEILVNAVKGITELVTEKGLVNLDFADVRTIMQGGGLAMIGLGESDSEQHAEEAAEKALQNPLLDVEISGAKSALINITGGKELSLKSSKTIMKIIADQLDPSARIIWGARLDESMDQSLRVMLIVTCLKNSKKSPSEIKPVSKLPKPDPPKVEDPIRHKHPGNGHSEKAAASPTNRAKTAGNSDVKTGSQVFSEIFIDESRSDLKIMERSVSNLAAGDIVNNEKALREIKLACTSIYNASELFSFDKIASFTQFILESTDTALTGHFDLSHTLVDIYGKIPAALDGMIMDKAGSDDVIEAIKEKLGIILDSLTGSSSHKPAEQYAEMDIQASSHGEVNSSGPGLPGAENKVDAAKHNVQAKTVRKPNEAESGPSFSNVQEAVNFVDKLL